MRPPTRRGTSSRCPTTSAAWLGGQQRRRRRRTHGPSSHCSTRCRTMRSGPSRSRRAVTPSRWASDLKTIGRESGDGRSITIYDATTHGPCAPSVSRPGCGCMDMADVRRRHGDRADDGGRSRATHARLDEPGAIRVAVWGPGDTTPGSTADGVDVAQAGTMRGSVAPCRPTIGRSCSRTRLASARACCSTFTTARSWRSKGEHSAPIMGGAFSPDGSLVATSGDDGATRLWNAATGSLVETLTGHDGKVWAPAFSDARRPPHSAHRRVSTAR